jgi:hypothetical protein
MTREVKNLVNGPRERANPILLAAVDRDNRAALSFRGSTTVHADDR